MEEIRATYLGDLRTQVVHTRSGREIPVQKIVDEDSNVELFSPTDLMCAALSSCMISMMAEAAKEKGFSIEGTVAKTSKIMARDPDRIGEIVIEFIIPGGVTSEKQKRVLERSAMMCPVALSLHPQIMLIVSFYYSDSKQEVTNL